MRVTLSPQFSPTGSSTALITLDHAKPRLVIVPFHVTADSLKSNLTLARP